MRIVSPETCHPQRQKTEDTVCAEPIIVCDAGPPRAAEPRWVERFRNPISLVYQTDEDLWASLGNWDL
jgi:hypothetical protein